MSNNCVIKNCLALVFVICNILLPEHVASLLVMQISCATLQTDKPHLCFRETSDTTLSMEEV